MRYQGLKGLKSEKRHCSDQVYIYRFDMFGLSLKDLLKIKVSKNCT